ncbi:class I SAM-dependent methyltransferase family protein [Micromonospora sp. NPDC050417]|uniref:class I SAM-dependent methyltransferase family protein n=1 Tax=Micromonospora sp. NPDC050417 TaxID=3364280 RepID=UPI00378EB02D
MTADSGTNRYGKAWHDAYDQPGSPLWHRLQAVQEQLRRALAGTAPGPIRLVSACAGQGRDVVGVLRDHPRRMDVQARLIEWDPENAARARADTRTAGLDEQIEVVEADAGLASPYADAVPAEVVLMCGVFGNISDADVRATVTALPQLCAPDAFVIWTRHRQDPDLTPALRQWFAEAGFRERDFVAPADLHFSVGLHQLTSPPARFDPTTRYFRFTR